MFETSLSIYSIPAAPPNNLILEKFNSASSREVDDEVYGGIEDEAEVVEAGDAEDPGGRDEFIATPGNIIFVYFDEN